MSRLGSSLCVEMIQDLGKLYYLDFEQSPRAVQGRLLEEGFENLEYKPRAALCAHDLKGAVSDHYFDSAVQSSR